jgi:hypothetical protein
MPADTRVVPPTPARVTPATLRARAARARLSARYLSLESDRQLVLTFASELEAEATRLESSEADPGESKC